MVRLRGLLCLALQTVASHFDAIFEAFVQEHNKEYSTPESVAAARSNLRESIIILEEVRVRNPRATFGLNENADLSAVEFRKRFGGGFRSSGLPPPPPPTEDRVADFSKMEVQKIDWRLHGAVDPTIFQQGECGCCWAISVTQTVGSQAYLTHNLSKVPSLSFQQLICCDCGNVDGGCHGGDPHMAYAYIQRAGGLESSLDYPFTDSGPDAQSCNLDNKCAGCKFDKSRVIDGTAVTGYKNVTQTDPTSGNPGNETLLAETVAETGPLSVCIDSDPWRFYMGGILDYGARNLNHCVQLIGFDATNNPPYWILKNSWGASWGEQGYIRMKMGMDICGVADVVTVPIV